MDERFTEHLRSVTVTSIFPEQRSHILYVPSTATIAEVYKVLTENRILSVPVLDKSLAKPRFSAFIDVIDIVTHVVSKIPQSEIVGGPEIPEIFSKYTAGEVVGASERNPFHGVEDQAPLKVALELMVKWKVHRIPVVDAEGHLETLITQSHVIKYIHDYMYLLKETKNKTIEELDLGTRGVVTVHYSETLLEGFKTLSEKKLSAIGVVDASGILVGNLSASDIKIVGYDKDFLARMFSPIEEFLKAIRGELYTKGNVIIVHTKDTFESVINRLIKKNVHRVYVVDFEGKPLRIITLTDILACLFNQDET